MDNASIIYSCGRLETETRRRVCRIGIYEKTLDYVIRRVTGSDVIKAGGCAYNPYMRGVLAGIWMIKRNIQSKSGENSDCGIIKYEYSCLCPVIGFKMLIEKSTSRKIRATNR
jgi:hypothetical protein